MHVFCSTHGLVNLVRARNITTVGEISSLTEKQVQMLPIKSPKVLTLRSALHSFQLQVHNHFLDPVVDRSKDDRVIGGQRSALESSSSLSLSFIQESRAKQSKPTTKCSSAEAKNKAVTTPTYQEDSFMFESDPNMASPTTTVTLATPESSFEDSQDPRPISIVQHDHTYSSQDTLTSPSPMVGEVRGVVSEAANVLSQELFSEGEGEEVGPDMAGEDGEKNMEVQVVESRSHSTDNSADTSSIGGVASHTHIKESAAIREGGTYHGTAECSPAQESMLDGVVSEMGNSVSNVITNMELNTGVNQEKDEKVSTGPEPATSGKELEVAASLNLEHRPNVSVSLEHLTNVLHSSSEKSPLEPLTKILPTLMPNSHGNPTVQVGDGTNSIMDQICDILPRCEMHVKSNSASLKQLEKMIHYLIDFLSTVHEKKKSFQC